METGGLQFELWSGYRFGAERVKGDGLIRLYGLGGC